MNKSLYCMFLDPFLPRVAVTVGKGSGFNCNPQKFKTINNSISRVIRVLIDKPEDSV